MQIRCTWLMVLFSLNFAYTNACSAIVLKNEKSVLLAKNFDWTFGNGHVIKNLRGIHKTAFYTSEGIPASWVSKFGSVTFNQNGKEMPYGGMNEKGLAVEMLWLDYTEYYNNDTTAYINELEWIQYQLDNYATSAEVIQNIYQFSIRPFKGKIHYIIADAEGHSVVIEHIAGKISYETNPITQCQAITNYDHKTSASWHAANKNERKGNVTNALYRYSVLQSGIDKNNLPADLSEITAFELLNTISIKKGNFKTFWSIVYDLKKKEIYFKSSDFKNIKNISLDQLDYTNRLQGTDINTEFKGNINNQLSDFTQSLNKNLIAYCFTQLGLEKLDFDEISDHHFNFSAKKASSYLNHYAVLKINLSTPDSTKLGRLGIAIFDNEDHLKNFTPYKDGKHQILLNNSSYSWIYYGLPIAYYSIAAAQDINNNQRPDFDIEKYAFSRDVRVVDGKIPSFESCKELIKKGFNQVNLILK